MKKARRKMLSVLCMVLVMISMMPTANAADPIERLVISQVYGAGGKGDSAVSHSFIELYNPTSSAISLDGYSISYMSSPDTSTKAHLGSTNGFPVTLALPNVSIPAKSFYLIRCAAEVTSSAVLTLDAYDCEWADRYIDNEKKADLSGFDDAANASDYAKDALAWAVSPGIIEGDENSLEPGGAATRAQTAAVSQRFLEHTSK